LFSQRIISGIFLVCPSIFIDKNITDAKCRHLAQTTKNWFEWPEKGCTLTAIRLNHASIAFDAVTALIPIFGWVVCAENSPFSRRNRQVYTPFRQYFRPVWNKSRFYREQRPVWRYDPSL
jgi:hypothetical protein